MRCLFFDIDGTLASREKGLIPSAAAAIHQARENGDLVFLATGRNLGSLDFVKEAERDGILFCNGAGILFHDTVIRTCPIPREVWERTVEMAEDFRGSLTLISEQRAYKNKYEVKRLRETIDDDPRFSTWQEKMKSFRACALDEYRGEDILKIDIGFPDEETMDAFQKYMDPSLHLARMAGNTKNQGRKSGELTDRSVNKGRAAEEIVRYQHGDMHETYGFGDSGNDLELLKACHTGIAMGNASEDVKAAADYVTEDVNDDGLAKAMAHFFNYIELK